MKFKKAPIAVAVAGVVGLFAPTLYAQTAPSAERVEITGTRIPQADLETAQPVLLISRQDIEKQGFQSVVDILQNVTGTGAPPISRASPLSAGENAGGAFISMRNLGAARTLVLVNGRRLGISTSGLSDVSMIPVAAVERIEVLKDGASSIYGSDALGGVVNIITRADFSGAKASAYFGEYSEGDGTITKADFVMGFKGDRGSVKATVEWRNEAVVRAKDRPFSAFPRSDLHPTDFWTTVGQYGGFVTTATTAVPGVATGTRVILRDGGDPRVIADYRAQNTSTGTCAGATAATGCTPGSTADKSNPNQQTDLRTPTEAKALYVDGTFNITDKMTLRTNFLYNNRDSNRQVAGYPMQANTVPAASPQTPMAATSYFNPTGATISNWWRRTWEIPRVSGSTLDTYRFSATLEGSFNLIGRNFDWDVSYLNNTNNLVQSTYGNLNLNRTAAAVGPSFLNAQGQVQCGTALVPIPTANCVPFNPFLPAGTVGQGGLTNNQALQNFLFQEEHATGQTKTKVLSANITGVIYTLPAGDLAFALGLENRTDRGKFVPDALAVTGASTNLSSGPTSGGYSVDEHYLELQVPLLKKMFLAEELSLSMARRESDYTTFGKTTNDKVGVKWKPIKSLLVRGTVSEGFRAPTVADLYGGGSSTFSFYTDPCDTSFGTSATNPATRANCVAAMGPLANTFRQLRQGFDVATTVNSQTPVPFTSGSNPTLKPETSDSQTLGIVWSPESVKGLNIAVDWWNIRIENTIVADSPTLILNDCYVTGITSRCSPALFTRDATLGYVNMMNFGSRNAGFREVEGVDFDLSYRFKAGNYGTFSIVSNSTYTFEDVLVSTNDPRVPINSAGFGSSFRLRSNLNLGWEKAGFGVNFMSRFYSAMKESCTYFIPGSTTENLECDSIDPAFPTGAYVAGTSTPATALTRYNRKGATTFHDVQARWEAPWKATIAVGANNVFNKRGPVMYSQPSANVSYYGGFDIGRFWYIKYNQAF